MQSLAGSGYQRTNVLENFFILSRQNPTWTGVGYVVDTTNEIYQPALPFFHDEPTWRSAAIRRCFTATYHERLLPISPTNTRHEPFDGRRGGSARARL